LSNEGSLNNSDFSKDSNPSDISDTQDSDDTVDGVEALPPSSSDFTAVLPLGMNEYTKLSPLDDSNFTAVIGPGADNLVVPLNTRSLGQEDDHDGDWAMNWEGQYCPWIDIVDANGERVSDAYVEVSWTGPYYFNWYRSGQLVLKDGRLLIQAVDPTNFRAIESGDVTFSFTIKSYEDDQVLGVCSAGPVHLTWDWGPWIQVDSGLDDLTIPADTWSTGGWDSHGSRWSTGADFKFYPSVRIVDGNKYPIEKEMTVTWNGDFLINGKASGALRIATGNLMIYSIEPQSGILPEERSEILLSFSFRGAGRDYQFDDVGPIRVNWVPTIVEEDSLDSPYWVYIDGWLDELDVTVPTQRWTTATSDNHGGWWSEYYGGQYCPSIWVVDDNFDSFWADVTV
jgi:hypothetical protein